MPLVWIMIAGAGSGLGAGRLFGDLRVIDVSKPVRTKRLGDYAIVTTQAGTDGRSRDSDVSLGNMLHVASVTIRHSW